MVYRKMKIIILFIVVGQLANAQRGKINWSDDGNSYTVIRDGNIVQINPLTDSATIMISKAQLTDPETKEYLKPQSYVFNNNFTRLLIFTNTEKVWRDNTRGDYWVLDIFSSMLRKLGKKFPAKSLMFAKFSPDDVNVAYVMENNIYVEQISTGEIRQMTKDGTRKKINGTFDWAYEEEFGCQDGFRWSPDGLRIAFWQVDATRIKDYYMLNTTDGNYSKIIPVEYPKVGETPSSASIGVVTLYDRRVVMMDITGNPEQHYLPRMSWSNNIELVVQQLDRRQQVSNIILCDAIKGTSRIFLTEKSTTWVEVNGTEDDPWRWVNGGLEFVWVSEKDGLRHIYRKNRIEGTETLLTKGNYDIGDIKCIDEERNFVYFTASPEDATALYLYRVPLDRGNFIQQVESVFKKAADLFSGSLDEPDLVSSKDQKGVHQYDISPTGRFAYHSFSNYNTPRVSEWITLPNHKPVNETKSIAANIKTDEKNDVEYLRIYTDQNITVDAWINKPKNFDPSKKYPVVLYVYGEPAASTVMNRYGAHSNFLYNGDMRADGYIQVSIDNRGTPVLRGAAWRKSIYRKIGDLNIVDQAGAFKKLLQNRPYFDAERTAVWGWSGGGTSTLNLLFRYPELFKTGISIAAVSNQLFYDNIYQERYMGLPQENMKDFVNGSPITYAKNLQGNLLYIHGTGDDNVHFSNAEVLVNELIKHSKQFQYMPYPNRSHSISEGAGTFQHLSTLYTNYLKEHCPPGAR